MATLGFINGGNLTSLGIGTTNPNYKLDIQGGNLSVQNGGNAFGQGGNVYFVANTTNSPMAAIGGYLINAPGAYDTGDLVFYTRINSGSTPALTEKMRVTNAGNVGIGVTNPQSNMQVVVGDVVPTASGSMATGMIITSGAGMPAMCLGARTTGSNYTWIHSAYINNSGVSAPLVLQPIGGSVGIGTTNPLSTLHILGTGANFASSAALRLDNGVTTWGFYGPDTGNTLYIKNAAGAGVYLLAGSASLLAPITDNTTPLGASGNRWTVVYAVNGTIQTSDARQKTNVASSSLGLQFINKLNPVSYKWIVGQNAPERPGRRTFYGFMAQDVKKTLDDLEVPDFAGWTLADVNDPESAQGLRYTEFIAPMVKSIQELSATVQTQQTAISSLEARLAALEQRDAATGA